MRLPSQESPSCFPWHAAQLRHHQCKALGSALTTLVDYTNELHSQPVPADCALNGIGIRAQGFRAETSGSIVTLQRLNALDLVIGG